MLQTTKDPAIMKPWDWFWLKI